MNRIRHKSVNSGLVLVATSAVVLFLSIGCGADGGDEASGEFAGRPTESTQQSALDSDATTCNLPAPEKPLHFASRQSFALSDGYLSLPVELASDVVTSDLVAAAMLFDGVDVWKVSFSPSWKVDASGVAAMHVPLDVLLPNGPQTKLTTMAVEVTHRGTSEWSEAFQVTPGDGDDSVLLADLQPSAGVTSGLVIPSPGELPSIGTSEADDMPPIGTSVSVQSSQADDAERDPSSDRAESIAQGAVVIPSAVTGGQRGLSSLTTVCFRQVVLMNGEGIGEDWLTADSTYGSVGMYVSISGLWSGFLNSSGCTPSINLTTNTYSVTAYAYGKVNSRYWWVDTNDNGVLTTYSFNADITEGGVSNVVFWPITVQQQFNIAMFASTALYFNPGSSSGFYTFHALNTIACGGGSCNSGGEIYIASGAGQDKFLVGHEHGHAFFAKNTTQNWPADYSVVDGPWPCNAGGSTSHDIDSKELSSVTFNEAAASFYGAAVFNSMSQADCWLYHPRYTSGVDCESGQTSPSLPLRFMEQTCNTPYPNRGVELDWLRQLWDVRTNGASPPSTNTMLTWIDSATTFTTTNAYQVLDAEANMSTATQPDGVGCGLAQVG